MKKNKQIKSDRLWIESQKLLITQLELQKENAIKNIDLNKKSLIITKQSINHEKKMLDLYLKNTKRKPT